MPDSSRIFVASFSIVLLLAACGTSPGPACSSATCEGCCTPAGICEVGLEAATCGSAGAACVDCGAGACVAGMCSGGTGGGGGVAGGPGGSSGGGSGGSSGGSGGGSAGTCVCPMGYGCSAGACVGGNAENLTLDVKSPNVISVGGTILYNGAAPLVRIVSTGCGVLALTSVDGRYAANIDVDCTAVGNVTFSGRVVAGMYQAKLTSSAIPLPEAGVTLAGVDLRTSQLAVPLAFTGPAAVRVTGKVLKNGVKPVVLTTGRCGTATFTAPGQARGLYTYLDCTTAGDVTFDTPLLAGTYTAALSGAMESSDLTSQALPGSITVSAGMGPLTLNASGGPRITVSGNITLNGMSPSLVQGLDGFIVTFKSSLPGSNPQFVSLPRGVSPYSLPLAAGAYDVTLTVALPYDVSSIRRTLFTAKSLTATSTLNLDTALTTTPVGTTVTHNGVTLSEGYWVRFISPASGLKVSFYRPGATTTYARLPPDSYTVEVEGAEGGSLPPGSWPAGTVNVPASTANVNLSLAITTPGLAVVSAMVRHNGAPPVVFTPSGSTCGWVYFLRSGTDQPTASAFNCYSGTAFQVSDVRLARGTYRVSVKGDQLSSSLPNTEKVVFPALAINGNVSGQVLDVTTPPMAKVSGRVLSNGVVPLVLTQTTTSCGEVMFENLNGVDHQKLPLLCSNASQLTFQGVVVSGTYRVSVRGDMDTVLLPPEPAVVVDRLTVP